MIDPDAHDLDEDGEHEPEGCQPCVEAAHTVACDCRCGECCKRLIIEVTARDAAREPLIKAMARKLRDDVTGEYPPDDEADWLLNVTGPCVFYKEGIGCSIHATRPLVCRVFTCPLPPES